MEGLKCPILKFQKLDLLDVMISIVNEGEEILNSS